MKKRLILLTLLVVVACVALAACDYVPNTQVTFDLQNGSEVIIVPFDENFAIPQNPTNGDKVFGGWYTDAACTDGHEWTKPETLSSNITVYAKWTDAAVVYNVTFDLQNGSAAIVEPFDDDFVMPSNLTNGDKVFVGWYTDAACTKGHEWTKPETLSDNITVYAKWGYAVTFDAQNDSDATVVYFDEDFAIPADPTNGDKLFMGWYTGKNGNGTVWSAPSTLSENVTVYAYWCDKANIDDVLSKYDSVSDWNFNVYFALEDSDGNLYGEYIYGVENSKLSATYVYENNLYTDYFDGSQAVAVYYMDNGDGTYEIIDENNAAYDQVAITGSFDYTVLKDFVYYIADGDVCCPIDAQGLGDAFFGEEVNCTWLSFRMTVDQASKTITNITAIQEDTSEDYAGTYLYKVDFSEYDNISLRIPTNGSNNDDDLTAALSALNDYEQWNFQVVLDEDDGTNTLSAIYAFNGANFSMQMQDGVNTNTDYYVYDGASGSYICMKQQADGSYVAYTYRDADYETVTANAELFYLFYLNVYCFDYVADGGYYLAVDPTAVGESILGNMGEGVTYSSAKIYLTDGASHKVIDRVELVLTNGTDSVTYTMHLSRYGEVTLNIPTGSDSNDEALQQVLDKYLDDATLNLQADYKLEIAGASTSNSVLQYANGNIGWTYMYKSKSYTDYLWYDSEKAEYCYYSDNGDGTYFDLWQNGDYGELFNQCVSSMDYIDLSALSNCGFVLDGDHYTAKYPALSGGVLCIYSNEICTSLNLYIENGNLVKIVMTSTVIEQDEETLKETEYNLTYTITLSNFGLVELTRPEVGGSANNDQELQDVLDSYVDDTSWNFDVETTQDLDGILLNWTVSANGLEFSVYYLDEVSGKYITEYLVFDETSGQYIYYAYLEGQYVPLYYEDNADDFAAYYQYIMGTYYYFDFTALASQSFVKNGDHYSAVDPDAAAQAVLSGYEGEVYSVFDVYISGGYITQIVASSVVGSGQDAWANEYLLEFSKNGQVTITPPSQGGDQPVDPDPVNPGGTITSEFTSPALATSGSIKYDLTTGSAEGSLDGNGRGVQFTMKSNTKVVITSKTAVNGVTSVQVQVATNSTVGFNLSVKVGSTSLLCNNSATVKVVKETSGVFTFTATAAVDGNIVITMERVDTAKSMYISSVTVVCSGGGDNPNPPTPVDPVDPVDPPTNVMPEQTYNEATFDHETLQDKLSDGGKYAIGLPSTGSYNALIVPVQFANTTVDGPMLAKLNTAFNGTSVETGWESVKTFYQSHLTARLTCPLTFGDITWVAKACTKAVTITVGTITAKAQAPNSCCWKFSTTWTVVWTCLNTTPTTTNVLTQCISSIPRR